MGGVFILSVVRVYGMGFRGRVLAEVVERLKALEAELEEAVGLAEEVRRRLLEMAEVEAARIREEVVEGVRREVERALRMAEEEAAKEAEKLLEKAEERAGEMRRRMEAALDKAVDRVVSILLGRR